MATLFLLRLICFSALFRVSNSSQVLINVRWDLCYSYDSLPSTHSAATTTCSNVAVGGMLLEFANYDEFQTFQTDQTILPSLTFEHWIYANKCYNGVNIYCWRQGGGVSEDVWARGSADTDTGNGCVKLTNDVPNSVDQYYWLAEDSCTYATSFYCKVPCEGSAYSPRIGINGDESVSLNETLSFSVKYNVGTVYRFYWYLNNQIAQSGTSRFFTVGETPRRRAVNVVLVQENDNGGYLASPNMAGLQTEQPGMSSSPIQDVYRSWEMVTLTCNCPVDLTSQGLSTHNWYSRNSSTADWRLISASENVLQVGYSTEVLEYSCTYTFSLGTSPHSDPIQIEFVDGPTKPTLVIDIPGSRSVNENLQLTCERTSKIGSAAVFNWYINGQLVDSTSGSVWTTTSSIPGLFSYTCNIEETTVYSVQSDAVLQYYEVPEEYVHIYGGYCYTLLNSYNTRDKHRDSCLAKGGHSDLALIHSMAEFNYISDQLNAWIASRVENTLWVGEKMNSNEDEFLFGDGTTAKNRLADDRLLITNSMTLQYNSWSFSTQSDSNSLQRRALCKHPCTGGHYEVVITADISAIQPGQSVTLQCSHHLGSLYSWIINGDFFLENSLSNFVNTSACNDTRVDEYQCLRMRSDGQWKISDVFQVITIEKPTVDSLPHDINSYSTNTPVRLACSVAENITSATLLWYCDYGTSSWFPVELRRDKLSLNTNQTYQWTYKCELTVPDVGTSSTIRQIEIYAGPAMPEVEASPESWTHFGQYVTFTCVNQTVLTTNVTGQETYGWYADGELLVNETERVLVHTWNQTKVGRYACTITDEEGTSTISIKLSMKYTVASMCNPSYCQNQGTCYAKTLYESGCYCSPGFEGDLCERVTVIIIAQTQDFSTEFTATTAAAEILTGINRDLLSDFGISTASRIMMSTDALSIYGSRLLNATETHFDSLTSIAEGTMAQCYNLSALMQTINCSDPLAVGVEFCDQNNTQGVFDNMQSAMFDVGTSALKGVQNADYREVIQTDKVTMTIGKTNDTFDSVGAQVEVPKSLLATSGSAGSVMVVSTVFDEDPYFFAMGSDTTVFGHVFNLRIRDARGNDLDIPPEDPVLLHMSPTEERGDHVTMNVTKVAMHQVDVHDPLQSVMTVEFSVSQTQTLTLVGRKSLKPDMSNFDFNITVDGSGQINIHNNTAFNFTFSTGVVQVHLAFPNCSKVYLWTDYTDSSTFDNETMVSVSYVTYFFTVNYWDSQDIAWKKAPSTWTRTPVTARRKLLSEFNDSVTLTSMDEDGGLQFTSSIFSSFSLSRFVVAPNMINFDDVFANFSSKLADSPYVLALNCLLLFASILCLLYLRRLDRADRHMWTYLPMIDNDDRDEWIYTLSVHTALDSPATMSATPFFVLKGDRGKTYIRVLCDAVRQNFGSGSLSNFVLRTPHWLGDLVAIKIWTDGKGEQPEWQLDRIVVKDVSKNTNYLFVCQEWLALSKGDGQLCRNIPVVQPLSQGEAMSADMNIVSKQMLYNDHLWLSIAKRPSYSSFTRIQRFFCALTLLYLSMLTSAMFFETSGNDNSSQQSSLKLGIVEISYREVYVGMVSAVIIVIPGVVLTTLFTKRRRKDVRYDAEEPEPSLSVVTSISKSSPSIWPPPLDKKTSAALFNEDGTVNDSISFLKHVFKAFEEQRDVPGSRSYCFGHKIHPSTQENDDLNRPRSSLQSPSNFHVKREMNCLDIDSGGSCMKREKPPFRFPWWMIFIAYALMSVIIAGAAFLTIFYSLEWGGSVSLEWLLSIFFSTSASTFFIEPLKILFIGMILSFLFEKLAVREMTEIAPFEKSRSLETPQVPVPEIVHEPDTNSKEIKKRKQELQLRHKLVDIMSSMGIKIVMVVLIGIIALHAQTTTSYYQNAQIQRILGADNLTRVRNNTGIYHWLKDIVVENALPSNHYNGDNMGQYQRKFTVDGAHYRLGPIRIIQYRVKDTNECEVRDKLSGYIKNMRCLGRYGMDTEDERNFAINWTSCTSSCQSSYTYTPGAKWEIRFLGTFLSYGPGGYQTLLLSSPSQARSTIEALESSQWINEQTRGLLVEITVFNANTQLFTQGKALLEMPSFGSVIKLVKVKSANLYPYTTVWDYFVLFFQLALGIIEIAMLVYILTCMIRPVKGEKRLTGARIMSLFEVLLALTAFATYLARVVLTTQLLERVINNTNEFTSFDTVFLLDEIYFVCMSLVLFVRICSCLSPLSLNYQLFIMKQTLRASMPQLRGFTFMLIVFLMAFSAYFTVLRGSVTKNLCSILESFTTLLTAFLGGGKFRRVGGVEEMATSSGFEDISFRLMYGVFCFGSAILMINIATTILSTYLTEVKHACDSNAGKHPEYDAKLNQFMWARLDSFIKKVLFYTSKNESKQNSSGNGKNVHIQEEELFRKGRPF